MAAPPVSTTQPWYTTVPGTTIRFFLSSTFVDFQTERNILQKRVFPQLRQLCTASGFHLQPIDLRWGVSEAAGTDRQTLRICFDELERCCQLSPDFFLLIQLGERYGSYILPPQVPASLVDRLLPHLASEERSTFEAVYRRDENAVPAEYVLLRAEGPHDATDEALRLALVRAGSTAGLVEEDRLLFDGSATHREIQLGMLGEAPGTGREAGVLCAVRTFRGPRVGAAGAKYAAQDADRAERVRQLTEAVVARLPADNLRHYEVAWDGERGPVFDEKALAEAYLGLLRPKLEEVIATRTAAREAAQAEGRDAATLANATFEAERLAHFVGRDAPMAAVDAYLAAPAAVPLVLAGVGGSGKSTLLARVAEQIRAARPDAVLVVRYVGVTPSAESVRTLLDRLRADLAAAYGHEAKPVREDFERTGAFLQALRWATPERPLIIVIDALDQLGLPPVPLDWLPEALPPNVHLVVSVLDEPDRPELATLVARQPAPQMVALATMTAAEGNALLERWLANARRTLKPTQRAAVLGAFAQEGRPLHLRLAFEEARSWRSFDDVASLPPLDPTIGGLLTARFRWLERREAHGPVLTSHALGLLCAAKNGLAEDELLDVLAADDTVRADLQRIAPASPQIDPSLPLPPVLWARLYAKIQPYLTQRDADGAQLITFYHRQLHAVAEALYVHGDEGSALHCQLAHYFTAQPVVFDSGEHMEPNLRQMTELPYQQALGKLYRELEQTLTSIAFLEWKIAFQGTEAVLQDYDLLPNVPLLGQVARAIRLGAHILDVQPAELTNQLRGRLGSLEGFHSLTAHDGPEFRLDSTSLATPDGPLVRVFAGPTDSLHSCALSPDGQILAAPARDGIVWLWEVSTGRVLHILHVSDYVGFGTLRCQFSGDGRFLLCAIPYGSIQLWEVAAGRLARTIGGDLGGLTDCAFSPDGRYALTAAEHPGWVNAQSKPRFMKELLRAPSQVTQQLHLWDVNSGAIVRSFEGSEFSVTCCAFSPDGQLALAGTRDYSLRLWNVASGKIVHVLKGHTSSVNCCAFSSDGRYILSGGWDATLRWWDVSTGTLIRTLSGPGHDGSFICCAISRNGRLALSGALKHRGLQLWDLAAGELISTYPGQEERTSGCAFTPDGDMAVSVSWDKQARLWNMMARPPAEQSRLQHLSEITDCAFSPDGRFAASASRDRTLHVWDVATRTTSRILMERTGVGLSCAYSPDGRYILSGGSDTTMRLWDTMTWHTVRTFKSRYDVEGCAFSPDGKHVIGTTQDVDTKIQVRDTATGKVLGLLADGAGPDRYAFSPDGRFISSTAPVMGPVCLWDLRGLKRRRLHRPPLLQPTHKLTGHKNTVTYCVFTSDSRYLLASSWDTTLRLWDIETGETVRIFSGHTEWVNACALSTNDRYALSASSDHTLRLWAIATGEEVARWTHEAELKCCAFHPQQPLVIAGDGTGALHWLIVKGIGESGLTLK